MTTANLLREYHLSLSDMRDLRGLMDVVETFRTDNEILDRLPTPYLNVFMAHCYRVAGLSSPAECDQALTAAIKEIGNGATD